MTLPDESPLDKQLAMPELPRPLSPCGISFSAPIVKVTLPSVPLDTDRCGASPSQTPHGQVDLLTRIREAVTILESNVLAPSTVKKYQHNFRVWQEYRDLFGGSHYLTGDPISSATAIREFIAYLGIIKGLQYTTVQGYLSAVRQHHIAHGLADPTQHPFARSLLTGLKRMQGSSIPKRPVTVDMLLCIHEQLNFDRESDVLVWAALNVGFMLLCRASDTSVKLKIHGTLTRLFSSAT